MKGQIVETGIMASRTGEAYRPVGTLGERTDIVGAFVSSGIYILRSGLHGKGSHILPIDLCLHSGSAFITGGKGYAQALIALTVGCQQGVGVAVVVCIVGTIV